MKKTLLQQAKEVNVGKGRNNIYSEEEIELVLAWLRNEIGATQMCKVLGKKMQTGNYLYFVASLLKSAYLSGKLKITMEG